MKTLLLLLASLSVFAQSNQPTPLYVYSKSGVAQDTVIDNRSSVNRQITYVSAACTGTGSWTASLLYSSDNITYTSFGVTATIDQSTTIPIAWGFSYLFKPFLKLDLTGTVTCDIAGFQKLFVTGSATAPPSSQWTTSGNNIYYNLGSVYIGLQSSDTSATFHTSATSVNVTTLDGYGAAGPQVQIRNARGTAASPTATQSGDILGTLSFSGFGSTVRGTASARVRAIAAEAFTDSTKAAYLSFQVAASGASTASEVWQITQDGHFVPTGSSRDIGTALNPIRNLYMSGSLSLTTPLPVASGGTGATTAAAARTNLGLNLTGVYVGDGTTPAGLSASTTLQVLRRSKAVAAVQYEFSKAPTYNAADYVFTPIAPGGTLSAAAYNQVTMPYCPPGIGGVPGTLNYDYPVTISNATNNGLGSIRITIPAPLNITTGSRVTITGVGGVTAANGEFSVTSISTTTFDLVGSVFAGTYTSGGVAYFNIHPLYISGGTSGYTVTGTANNGAGLIRLTTTAAAVLATGNLITVSGVGGTTGANGEWTITKIDATHVDLNGSTYSGAYTSGGAIGIHETVKISGGTCTSEATSGTLRFYSTFSHSGSWTLASATGGAMEAMYSDTVAFKRIEYPSGLTWIDGTVIIPAQFGIDLSGQGINNTVLRRRLNTSDPIVFIDAKQAAQIAIHDLWINDQSLVLNTGAIAFHLKNITCCVPQLYNIKIWDDYIGVKVESTDQATLNNIQYSQTSFVYDKPKAGLYVTEVAGNTGGSSSGVIVEGGSFITSETLTQYGCYVISAAANNGSGLIRLTIPVNLFVTGDKITVEGITGVNGDYFITVIDATHVDLVGSTYAGPYVTTPNVSVATYTNLLENGILIESSDGFVIYGGTTMRADFGLRINPNVSISGVIVDSIVIDKVRRAAVAIGTNLSVPMGQIVIKGSWLNGNYYPSYPLIAIDMTNATEGRYIFSNNDIGAAQGGCVWLTNTKDFILHDNTISSCDLTGSGHGGVEVLSSGANYTTGLDAHDNKFKDLAYFGSTTDWAFWLNSNIRSSSIHDNNISTMAVSPFYYQAGANFNFLLADNITYLGLGASPSVAISASEVAIPTSVPPKLGITGGGTATRMTGGWPGMRIQVIPTAATDLNAGGGLSTVSTVSNSAGLFRVVTTGAHGLGTGQTITLSSIVGSGGMTAAINGIWTVTVINGTTFDLQNSTFVGAYTSGGSVRGWGGFGKNTTYAAFQMVTYEMLNDGLWYAAN